MTRMDLLRRPTVRVRLVLTLLAVSVVLVVPAIYGLQRLVQVRDIAVDLRGSHAVAALALGRLETALGEVDGRYRGYLAAPDSAAAERARVALRRAERELRTLAHAGYADEAIRTARAVESMGVAAARVERLGREGDVRRATDRFFEQLRPRIAAAEATLDDLAGAIDRRSMGATRRAHEIGRSAARTVLVALAAALLIAFVLGLRLTDALVRPVRGLRRAMAGVAGGELDPPGDLDYERADELGDLTRSFRAMTEQLAELNRTKAEFVSTVTHDLKTPIHVIDGYAQMLRDGLYGDPDPAQREALEALSEQVALLLEQVHQLLDVSRIEAGAFRIETDEVRLVDLCTSLRRSFEGLARQKPLDFEVELDPSAPETIRADEHRLRNEILGNLLGNAFKFTERGGRVSVRIAGENGHVHFAVEDDGRGIAPDDLPHVFDRYYRGTNGRSGNGSGLGLAIALQITEAHGGDISVRSAPGGGTAFLVRLPAS